MSVANFDENAGKVTIKVNKSLGLTRGAFYPTISLTDASGVSQSYKTAEPVILQTEVSYRKF